jgi:hypothetical protein
MRIAFTTVRYRPMQTKKGHPIGHPFLVWWSQVNAFLPLRDKNRFDQTAFDGSHPPYANKKGTPYRASLSCLVEPG